MKTHMGMELLTEIFSYKYQVPRNKILEQKIWGKGHQ